MEYIINIIRIIKYFTEKQPTTMWLDDPEERKKLNEYLDTFESEQTKNGIIRILIEGM